MYRSVLALVVMLAGCGNAPSDPETELRDWLSMAESEAEARDRGALMRRIADGYTDARGNDRDAIESLLRIYLLRRQQVAILTKVETIEVFGADAAELLFTVGMAGSDGTQGWSADAYRFALDLEKRDGDWLLIGARWAPLGDPPR